MSWRDGRTPVPGSALTSDVTAELAELVQLAYRAGWRAGWRAADPGYGLAAAVADLARLSVGDAEAMVRAYRLVGDIQVGHG